MTLLQFCGLGIVAVFAVLLLRESNRSYTTVVVISFVVLGFFLVIGRTSTAAAYLIENVRNSSFAPYVSTVLKAVGLALLGEMTCDLCKSAGEQNLASAVEVCAKAEIILTGLPLVSKLLETAEMLL